MHLSHRSLSNALGALPYDRGTVDFLETLLEAIMMCLAGIIYRVRARSRLGVTPKRPCDGERLGSIRPP
jgi:hypothetical protein